MTCSRLFVTKIAPFISASVLRLHVFQGFSSDSAIHEACSVQCFAQCCQAYLACLVVTSHWYLWYHCLQSCRTRLTLGGRTSLSTSRSSALQPMLPDRTWDEDVPAALLVGARVMIVVYYLPNAFRTSARASRSTCPRFQERWGTRQYLAKWALWTLPLYRQMSFFAASAFPFRASPLFPFKILPPCRPGMAPRRVDVLQFSVAMVYTTASLQHMLPKF